jgi:hypothetical protein
VLGLDDGADERAEARAAAVARQADVQHVLGEVRNKRSRARDPRGRGEAPGRPGVLRSAKVFTEEARRVDGDLRRRRAAGESGAGYPRGRGKALA